MTPSVSIAASSDDLDRIAELASTSGISSERAMELANSAGTPGTEIIILAAVSIGAVARCVSAFLRERKRRIQIFQPDRGWIQIDNPTKEQVTQLIESGSTLHIEENEAAGKDRKA